MQSRVRFGLKSLNPDIVSWIALKVQAVFVQTFFLLNQNSKHGKFILVRVLCHNFLNRNWECCWEQEKNSHFLFTYFISKLLVSEGKGLMFILSMVVFPLTLKSVFYYGHVPLDAIFLINIVICDLAKVISSWHLPSESVLHLQRVWGVVCSTLAVASPPFTFPCSVAFCLEVCAKKMGAKNTECQQIIRSRFEFPPGSPVGRLNLLNRVRTRWPLNTWKTSFVSVQHYTKY